MAVLSLPTNNALDPDVLPSTEVTASSLPTKAGLRSGTARSTVRTPCGRSPASASTTIPRGPASLRCGESSPRRFRSSPTYTQPLNNPVWNYLYAGHTGSACDQTLNNNITGTARMYVAGNLCLSPNVQLAQSTVIVGGNLDVSNNAAVGASTSMSTRVETYVGGNCRYSVGAWGACGGNQDARHIYSKLAGGDDRRERDAPRRPAADGGLRGVVRERDSGPVAELHDVQRSDPDVRQQLPVARFERFDGIRPDAIELVHLSHRSWGVDDALQRRSRRVRRPSRWHQRAASQARSSRSGSTTR